MRILGRSFYGNMDYQNNTSMEDKIRRLKEEIDGADAIVIGAGAGLSTSAGFTTPTGTKSASTPPFAKDKSSNSR